MKDTAFVGTAVAIPVTGLGVLMWRTGGVDLPDLNLGLTGWLVVALTVVALAAAIVGAAARTIRPVDRRPQQKIGSR